MKYLSKSLEETKKIAEDFINKIKEPDFILKNKKNESALVVGLSGDLGSGKTAFTQALGKILNIKEVMTSPTFVIEKKYAIPSDSKLNIPYSTLIHIDAYRLESGQELAVLDFKEMMLDPKNLILIEWPERVADILPTDFIKINFKFISESEREINML